VLALFLYLDTFHCFPAVVYGKVTQVWMPQVERHGHNYIHIFLRFITLEATPHRVTYVSKRETAFLTNNSAEISKQKLLQSEFHVAVSIFLCLICFTYLFTRARISIYRTEIQ
jgi:hypothetical protein